MIKSQGATKGNIKEANLAEWSETVTKIRDSFPEVMTVIPGHGGIGDKASLNYTISLFSSEETVDEVVTNLE
jgi:metallo-beta-lactamase class B